MQKETMVEDNSKINVGIHIAPHQESSSIEIAMEASFKSSDLSSRSGGSAPTQLWSFHEMQRRTTMRIRISNEISERSKDMVVDIRPSLSVYAAIYDSKSVRDAHVRKWGPEIVQKVKNGTAEIQCAVWDEVVGKPCHTFSLDELKHISTKKLHDLVPESVRVKLVLRCLDKEMESEKKTVDSPSIHPSRSSRTASSISRCPFSGMEISADLLEQFTDHILAQRNEDEKSQSSQESSSDEDETSSPTHFPNLDESRRPVTNTKLNEESYNDSFTNTAKSVSTVGESFAEDAPSVINVRVTNQVSQRTRDLLLPLVDQKSLFEAVYENPALKEGHVRKWSSEIAKQVKSGTAEIQLVLQRNTKTVQFFTLEHLKMISTAQFYHMLVKERIKTTEIVHLELRCATKDAYQDDIADLSVAALESSMRSEIPSSMNQDKSDNDDDDDQDHISELHFASSHIRQDSVPLELLSGITRSLTDPSIGDTLLSLDLDLDHVSGIVPMVQKQTLRIRISNRTSHRFKDLVVDINDNLNLYDAIYDNKGVKDAHVRKWGPQMVQDVKRGMVEVQVVVWDDDAARPWRVFKVDELKTTTTRDLYESVPESCDLVKLFLECVRTKQIAHSIRLENGKPQSVIPPTSMRHCKSESCLKKGTSRRTTTRLNHMNLSGMSYGSNSSTLSDRRTGSLSNEFWNKLASVSDHNRQAGRPPRRKDQSQHIDIDAYLMRSKKISDRRSLSTADVRGNVNQAWSKRTNKSNPNEDVTLSAKVQRFLELSERRFNQRIQASESSQSFSTSQSSDLLSQDQDPQITYEDKIKEFMRLCNAKKTASLQSMKTSQRAPRSLQNETFPTIVQTRTEMDNPFLSRVSSITLQDRRASAPPLRGIPNASFLEYGLDMSGTSGSLRAGDVHVPTTDTTSGKVIDRINRFLRLSEADQKAPFEHVFHKPISTSESMLSMRSSLESLKGDGLIATSMTIIDDPTKKSDVTLDAHPIAEIEVSKSDEEILPVRAGVSLSSDLVKEVFPYHLVLNSEFRILQIGNNLAQFIDEDTLIGRTVSDILMVASPIPMFGKWDWNIMDKMKDKTIFLESLSNSYNTKVKIKGTMIEISSSPRTVMLALFPNVKNLSELEDMNLSIADLPLHSCQREAVLLGEHSKSEVKLTNHLDQLHRELINSMEKQIEDRTNELAMANLDLERANSQLAIQSARQLEHFACMSHEIRTPLNCIVGMSSLLLDDADEMDPMHADSIRMINTSGDLLKAVVDDVLDYAKLESGSFEVDIKPTNLQETLASVVHSISQRVQEKNIRLRTHYSPTLPLVLETDSRRLQQVLFNLLGNASKFSKPNSVIDLSVTLITGPLKQEQGQPVKFSPSGQIVRFSVKDYGKGIDKKDFTTIFEPFSQASKETQTIYGGTGLGLSITSKLVHRLGGTVGLDSEPGKFTEFTVDLPFDGTAVDIADVRRKMAQTTLIVVEPGIKDYSFNEDPFKPEPISFDKEVTSIYGLDVVRCCSLHDAADQLSERKKQGMDRHFALLVQENLFNFDAKDMIDAIVNSSECTLMTFGPNFSVDLTKGWHFKSLLGVFPATLLETIAYYRLRQVQSLGSSSSTDSDPSACGTVKEVPETTANREEKSFDHVSIQSDTVLSHEANKGLFALLAVEGCEQSRKGEETSAFLSPMAELNETNPSASRTKPVNSSAGGLFASLSRAGGFQEVVPAMRETSPKPTPKSADGLFVPLRRDDGKVANSTGSLQNSLSIRTTGGTGTSRGLSSGSSLRQIVPVKRSSKTRPPKRALKVMYVEDNVINQKVFSKMLSRAGIDDITIVDNGQKAVDMCDSETFDVIFMDYEMPVMDGMEATKLIVHRDPNAKVIFVTAHALEEFKMEARSVGAIGFFSKPVRPRDIEDLLDSLDVVNKKADSFEASPLHRDTTTISKTMGSKLSVPKRQLKVLYAEDNIINQKVLSKALNRSGLTDVTIVGNGKLAVELCQSMEYDCVFMDVEMPVMGGLEACKEIMEKNPSARVVFVTAHTLEEFRKKGDAVGAWDYVSKPFRLKDIDELLDRLEVACSKPHFDLEEPAIISDSPPLGVPPPNTPASAVKAVKTAKAPPRDRHLKVLYAEDNLVNQKVLCRILNRAGISDVTIVDNGKSAVDLCRSVNYSCIFLDMQMPVMDGIEACRQIVKNDPNATVIFVTAHALDEFKAQTVAIGAKSFITKPFRLSDIQKVLDELNLE